MYCQVIFIGYLMAKLGSNNVVILKKLELRYGKFI